ncbi:unnamed protein product, partial [Laminaria digitata]
VDVPVIPPQTKRRVRGGGKGIGARAMKNLLFGSRFRDRIGDALERSVQGLEEQLWTSPSAAEDRVCDDQAKVTLEEVETCLLQVETQVLNDDDNHNDHDDDDNNDDDNDAAS